MLNKIQKMSRTSQIFFISLTPGGNSAPIFCHHWFVLLILDLHIHTWNHTMYRILFKTSKSSPNMSFLYFLGLFRDGLHRGCSGHGPVLPRKICNGQRWEVGGIGMGKTCEPKAFSFQCMTELTTNKKKKRWEVGHSDSNKYKKLQLQVKNSLLHSVIPEAFRWESPLCQPLA